MILNQADNIYIGSTGVDKIYLGTEQVWPSSGTPAHDYSQDYLTITAIGSGNTTIDLVWDIPGNSDIHIQVSTDNGTTWNNMDTSSANTAVVLQSGESLIAKGTNIYYSYDNEDDYRFCSKMRIDGRVNVSGNIMSLFYGDNFTGQTTFPIDVSTQQRQLVSFFAGTDIVDAENLVLPATMTLYCYEEMFSGCTYLYSAPSFAGQNILHNSTTSMFSDCPSLSKMPVFNCNAVSLGNYMFHNCSALQRLVFNCDAFDIYNYPFNGCTSLNYFECGASTINNYYSIEMLPDVPASGTFVKKTGVSWPAQTIPTGWTVIDQ